MRVADLGTHATSFALMMVQVYCDGFYMMKLRVLSVRAFRLISLLVKRMPNMFEELLLSEYPVLLLYRILHLA